MRKRTALFTILVLSLFFIPAYGGVFAQSDTTKKALEDVKESLDTLVEAKDEDYSDEVALRVETYRKVVDFSTSEAKDLKLKLLSYDSLKEPLLSWKDDMAQKINKLLSFYDNEKKSIEASKDITLEKIQIIAEQFKEEREKRFIPLSDEINLFLIINQGEKAIEMTEARWKKIQDDLKKLENAGADTKKLKILLGEANENIEESKKLESKAMDLFIKKNALPLFELKQATTSTHATSIDSSVLTASSTETRTTSTEKLEDKNEKNTEITTTTKSNNNIATTTDKELQLEEPPEESIKDLIKSSILKIKDAYKIFIEMSSLVRKLL